MDSVALLALYRELGDAAVARAEADGMPEADDHRFLLACAIDPSKRLERDLVPQYLKLGPQGPVRRDVAITQVGYDARKWGELHGGPSAVARGHRTLQSARGCRARVQRRQGPRLRW